MATPGDKREDHAQAAADLIAAEYANAELMILAAMASLAKKVATGPMTPQQALKQLRRTVVYVMTALAPRVQAMITAQLAATLRQALATHGHQVAEPEPEPVRSPMRQWKPPFAQAPRQTAEWEKTLAGLINHATDTAEEAAEQGLRTVCKAIEAASEPPNPYQAALDRALGEHGGWPGSTLSARRIRAAQAMLGDLADRGITGFTDRTGRRWDLASYVEMATRTVVSNAWDDMQAQAALRAGIDLADIGTYSQEGSCLKCLPWLGRTISLFGKTPGYPLLAQAKAEGFRHPSCRCFWVPRGLQSVPEVTNPVSPEESAQVYAASQQQRALERHVRAAGRAALTAVTPQARSKARRSLTAARAASASHRREHGLIMTKVGIQRRERTLGAR